MWISERYRRNNEKQFKLKVILGGRSTDSKVQAEFSLHCGSDFQNSLLIFPKGTDFLEIGHAGSLQQSFPEKSGKARQEWRAGCFGWVCILVQHVVNVAPLWKNHCAKVFGSPDPDSDFASLCSANWAGGEYRSLDYMRRGAWGKLFKKRELKLFLSLERAILVWKKC